MSTFFKQFGAERTGTNYIRQLMLENIKDVVIFENIWGWKHGEPFTHQEIKDWYAKEINDPIDRLGRIITPEDKVHPLVIVKNPYTWLNSIVDYRKRESRSIDLAAEYKKFNTIYRAYKDIIEAGGNDIFSTGYAVQYENLLIDSEKEIHKIVNVFGLELKDYYIEPRHVKMSGLFDKVKKNFYLKGPDRLNPKLAKIVNALVDWDLMSFYGYTRRVIS